MPEWEGGDEQEKTEEPTQRRREEARNQGNVSKSPDLNAAVIVLAGVILLRLLGPFMGQSLMAGFKFCFENFYTYVLNLEDLYSISIYSFLYLAQILLPFILLMAVVAFMINFIQVGFLVSIQPIIPNLDKINPISGLLRMFSLTSLFKLVLNIIKVSIVLVVGWYSLKPYIPSLMVCTSISPFVSLKLFWDVITIVGIKVGLVLLVLGLMDYGYTRWRYEKSLMMSKQELKEELKTYEGDPMIKSRRQALARQLIMRKILTEVPKADVVVTNPTEYAVALLYEEGFEAPKVIAKGRGEFAKKIREIAIENKIPIVERPWLARALYKDVELGKEIPPEYYLPVIEILKYVYSISQKKRNKFKKVVNG